MHASCCVEISYNYTKTNNESGFKRNRDYSFPWRISPEGILENLKVNEDTEKIDVFELRHLNHRNREFEGLLKVKDGKGVIDTVEIQVVLADGNYQVYNILGQHFIDVNRIRTEDVKVGKEFREWLKNHNNWYDKRELFDKNFAEHGLEVIEVGTRKIKHIQVDFS